ncbi:MAG TPA: hypothetical protein VLI71_17710 [Gammaproteobacteria bacterium]|nr:hypothetical protein [Gammaproteobacteria bacterium]
MIKSFWVLALGGLAAVAASTALESQAQNAAGNVPKQVHLVLDGNRVLASNVRLNRFDELKLGAQERIREQQVGQAVAIVVTNQRIIAYGVLSGWVATDRVANETIQSVSAEDYAGLIVTDQRMLNFNGETGVWAEQKRRVSR